jgi:hypothetical protein
MQYQVSRNGQTYGPYTLEDLQRYVASGNILPTDMAKSEDMPEWVPVSQILGAFNVPAPAQYVAPAAYPPSAIPYPDPPNLSWGLLLLFGFLTCTLFVAVWNLVIAAWVKKVQPNSQVFLYYIIATVLIVAQIGTGGMNVNVGHMDYPTHYSPLGGIVTLVCWVVRLIARFKMRDALEQHFNGPEPLGLRLSGVMTFFFGGIYFQYKLNEITQIKQTLRYRNAIR